MVTSGQPCATAPATLANTTEMRRALAMPGRRNLLVSHYITYRARPAPCRGPASALPTSILDEADATLDDDRAA